MNESRTAARWGSAFPVVLVLFLLAALAVQAVQSTGASLSQETFQGVESQEVQKVLGAPSRLGIVDTKPTGKERFVEVDGGFMVAYQATVPGTEIKYTMVPIPGGTFTMGSPEDEEDRGDDEGPQFEVTVKPFWMGKFEVTWAEYQHYMGMCDELQALQRTGIRKITDENKVDGFTAPSNLYDPGATYYEGDGLREPAATMSQFAAKQYTKWLSKISKDFYRLPTEAEWEYACRAGTKTAYHFGDDVDELEDYGWFEDNSEEVRTDCGQLKPNKWGLYDMYGNVAEWVLDQYDEDGYTHVEAGAKLTVEQAYRKPTKLFPRVVRGGYWESTPEECRSASRLGSEEYWREEDPNVPKSPWWLTNSEALGVGFRVIRPLTAPETDSARNEFWDADLPSIMEDVGERMTTHGKGNYAPVDPDLPKDIQRLNKK